MQKEQTIKNKKSTQASFFLTSGFAIGKIPFAPGSFGTLLGFPIAFLIADFSLTQFVIFFTTGLIASILLIELSKPLLNEIDDKRIVIDEYFAFALLLYFLPFNPVSWILAYILFRFFDIFKPCPICFIDRSMKNSLGVMLDDLLAVLLSYLCFFPISFLFSYLT